MVVNAGEGAGLSDCFVVTSQTDNSHDSWFESFLNPGRVCFYLILFNSIKTKPGAALSPHMSLETRPDMFF